MRNEKRCLDVLHDVLDRLPREADEGGWEKSSTSWTKRLISQIRDAGSSLGFEVRPGPRANRGSGWLYDMVWLGRRNDQLVESFLVLESEWEPTPGKIFEDFEKLLLARAAVRVMVFNRRKVSQVRDTFVEMEKCIRAYSMGQANDFYFLAGLAWDTGAFEYHEVRL